MINHLAIESPYGIVELVEIVDSNGNATQMPKSVYDNIIATQKLAAK